MNTVKKVVVVASVYGGAKLGHSVGLRFGQVIGTIIVKGVGLMRTVLSEMFHEACGVLINLRGTFYRITGI